MSKASSQELDCGQDGQPNLAETFPDMPEVRDLAGDSLMQDSVAPPTVQKGGSCQVKIVLNLVLVNFVPLPCLLQLMACLRLR